MDEKLAASPDALHPPHELVLLAVHVLAVADVDCPGPTSL